MILLNNIGKAFDGKWAVKDLSLEIPKGEIFGLVGPNGAGKTTAIRMMTGLLSPTEGNALIGGFDIQKEPMEAKSIIGYIPDRPFLYEKLTAKEFLLFISSIYNLEKNKAVSKAGELLETFGLKDVEHSFIESYSHGMRQRLVFASALIHDPKIIIIDEPFVGLDPFGVLLIRDIIRRLAEEGASVFLATHSLHIAGELCHRVGLINRGRLTAVKPRDEIKTFEGGLEGFFLKEASE
jgi:ABC-2 type transport system ATP-binding protein